MKKFLKIFPFILVFLLAFGMHVKLDVEEQVKPFLEPFGRDHAIGAMKPNRPAQVVGGDRFAWLEEKQLVIAALDPAGQTDKREMRPVPDEDIFSNTNFRIVDQDIIWVGNKRTLKRATWQGNAWSTPQEIATQVHSMDVQVAGDKKVLVAGVDASLRIWEITADGLQDISTLPFKKVVYTNTTADRQGVVHVGLLEQNGSSIYRLIYLTIDPQSKKVSEPLIQKEVSTDTSQMIYDNEFGIDNTHGYYVMTFTSTKTNSSDLRLFSFPLNQPTQGKLTRLHPETTPGRAVDYAYGAVLESGQGESLRLLYAAEWGKSPRVGGYEVFISTLQNGEMLPEAQRVSNSRRMAVNPMFAKVGDSTVVLYSLFSNFDNYTIYFNSDHPQYAASTNQLTTDDYTYSAMRVPQFLGVATILMFYGLAWPVLSYLYIGYFVYKKEDTLYDHADRHLLVSVVLYLASQIFIFLNYAKLDNLYIYAPEWMHSHLAIGLVMLGFGVVSYLVTKLFGKLIYERYATVEFGYFALLNLWMVLLFFSYFMAR